VPADVEQRDIYRIIFTDGFHVLTETDNKMNRPAISFVAATLKFMVMTQPLSFGLPLKLCTRSTTVVG
jgi:hypothetical protein